MNKFFKVIFVKDILKYQLVPFIIILLIIVITITLMLLLTKKELKKDK